MPEVVADVVITPALEWGAVHATVTQGSSFTINGSGYEPGQRISISFGLYQTDAFIFIDESAFADADGNYSFTITLAPDLEPRTYGVTASTPDDLPVGPAVWETRRNAIIEVVAS